MCVRIGGHALEFSPLTTQESSDVVWEAETFPAHISTICDQVCAKACLSEPDAFTAMVEEYPLACTETILQALMQEGGKQAQARIDAGVKAWRAADRNYGRVAGHLLAFKEYTGGEYSKDQMAGALAIAEAFGTIGSLLTLINAYMRKR